MATSYNGAPAFEDLRNCVAFSVDFGDGKVQVFPQGTLANDDLTAVATYALVQRYKRAEPNAPVGTDPKVTGWWGAEFRQNRNANNLSCHSSGTAWDFWAVQHPNHDTGNLTDAQKIVLAQIAHECSHVVRWGIPGLTCPTCGASAGWSAGSTPDYMHLEATSYDPQGWAAAAAKLVPAPTPPQPTPPPPSGDLTMAQIDDIMAKLNDINAALHAPAKGVVNKDGKPSSNAADILAALLRQSQVNFNQTQKVYGEVLRDNGIDDATIAKIAAAVAEKVGA